MKGRGKYHTKTREEHIIDICIFLKLLWETTRKPANISLWRMTRQLEIPQADRLCNVLQSTGIIKKIGTTNTCQYQWISKTEPNKVMATAIMDKIHDLYASKKLYVLWHLDLTKTGLFY